MKKVIVIGGGVSGLAAGITALQAGYACEIFEKNAVTGGNLTGWVRNGYTVDNCIHWLTGTKTGTKQNQIWQELGALDNQPDALYRPSCLFTSQQGEEQLIFSRDPEKTKARMLELSPKDRTEILRFFDALDALFGEGTGMRRRLRQMCALWFYGKYNLYQLAARFSHPLLRMAMTDFLGGELCALALLFAYGTFAYENGDIPRGGSLAMAKRMTDRFLSLGGQLHLRMPVVRILRGAQGMGVVCADGQVFLAEELVCATDPAVLFSFENTAVQATTLPSGYTAVHVPVPDAFRKRYTHPENYPICSSLHAAFAVNRDAAATLCGTHTIDIRPMVICGRIITRIPLRAFCHEPDFAPEGKTVLQCLVFLRQPECEKWLNLREDPTAYAAEKKRFATDLAERIAERIPALQKELTPLDVWTPATYHRYFGSYYGSYMSFLWTRGLPHRRLSSRLPGFSHLHLATQWQTSPGGLPLAAQAGIRAVRSFADVQKNPAKSPASLPEKQPVKSTQP